MTHPANESTRLDPEQRVSVRALGEFQIRSLAASGGLETRVAAVGEQVRVERWLARDLAARELVEII